MQYAKLVITDGRSSVSRVPGTLGICWDAGVLSGEIQEFCTGSEAGEGKDSRLTVKTRWLCAGTSLSCSH